MPEQHLRPEFTKQLAARLLAGESINLIGAHGQGRRRTLQDLRSILPAKLSVHQLDLQRDSVNLGEWLTQFINITSPTLLILHNFHCLSEPDIFKQLNHLNSNKYLSCLYVSEEVLTELSLDAENLQLPALEAGKL
ncbi:MAG: hypothetical protein ABUK11_06340 [Mariprofundaceae bacterium]